MENKKLILSYFLRCLQLTRAGEDIKEIRTDKNVDTAVLIYRNGYKKAVDISADSGIAMIRDIAAAIS